MAGNRITLKLIPAPEDNGKIQFDALIDEMQSFASALKKTGRLVDEENEKVVIRISYMRQNSPPEIQFDVETESENGPAIVDKFSSSLRLIEKNEIPIDFDDEMLNSYKNIGARFGRGISGIQIFNGSPEAIVLTPHYSATITSEIIKREKPDMFAFGSIIGRLEQANVHGGNKCTIYPFIGKKISCEFDELIKSEIKGAFDTKVRASGKITYKSGSKFPTFIVIRQIEQIPDDNTLPRLSDIKGIAPNATGKLSTDEFIFSNREDWI